MAAKQAMKENLQYTSKYGPLRISQDICHVRMTDIEGLITIYRHSDNLLNNNNIILHILNSFYWTLSATENPGNRRWYSLRTQTYFRRQATAGNTSAFAG